MRITRAVGVSASALLFLCGCLTTSGPAWLESGRIDMSDYAHGRVLILPVEITPPYDLDEGERRAIQDQVKNNLIRAFDLHVVDALTSVERTRLYPYTLDEAIELGQLYGVDAVAAISIFSLIRESPDPRSESNRVGMRVTFADSNDPTQSWSMSREYRSRSGFDTDSNRFDTAVRQDLAQVREELRSQYGTAAGFRKTVTLGISGTANPEGPRVTVNIPVLGSQFTGDERVKRPDLKTEQSLLQFRILAEDVSGLVRTEVTNEKAKFSHTLEYALTESKDLSNVEWPRRIDEAISVPLAVGENTVQFVTYNQRNVPRTNEIEIKREVQEFVYTLGVGISQYQYFGPTSVNSGDLRQRFESRAAQLGARSDNVIFLEGEEATYKGIERGLYNIGSLARRNDQGLGLFYFAGKVQARDEGVYLIAYDSEPKYVEVTGISTEDIQHWCQRNCHTILDLCESDPTTRQRLTAALPDAQISFDSCTPGQNKNADSLRERLNRGLSPKEAVQEVIKQGK